MFPLKVHLFNKNQDGRENIFKSKTNYNVIAFNTRHRHQDTKLLGIKEV